MKEVTHASGITYIADLDAIFARSHCRELQLRIPFSSRHVVTVSDFISIRAGHAEDWIQV